MFSMQRFCLVIGEQQKACPLAGVDGAQAMHSLHDLCIYNAKQGHAGLLSGNS
jgi:hypothetical protein